MKVYLLLLLLNSICLISTQRTESIAIIGSGVAGLSAAQKAKELGFTNVKVIEASDRVGGRIKSDSSLGFTVDLGAAWIHGITNNPVYNYVESKNINTVEFDYEKIEYKSETLTPDELSQLSNEIESTTEDFGNYLESKQTGRDEPLSNIVNDYLQGKSKFKQTVLKNLVSQEFENEFASKVEDLSKLYFDNAESLSGEDVLFPNGYSQLITELAKGVDIKLNSKVKKVSRGEIYEIELINGEKHTANYVICTVPLGILKNKDNGIKFEPELPSSHRDAIERLGFGVLDKVIVEFETHFWDNSQNLIKTFNETPSAFGWAVNFKPISNKNALVILIPARDKYYNLYDKTDSKIGEDVEAFFKRIYPTKNVKLINIKVTRWANDPYTLGSYSSLSVGSTPDDIAIFSTPHGRIYFAGEHTSVKNPSTVHGAYTSGIDAVNEIYNSINSSLFKNMSLVLVSILVVGLLFS